MSYENIGEWSDYSDTSGGDSPSTPASVPSGDWASWAQSLQSNQAGLDAVGGSEAISLAQQVLGATAPSTPAGQAKNEQSRISKWLGLTDNQTTVLGTIIAGGIGNIAKGGLERKRVGIDQQRADSYSAQVANDIALKNQQMSNASSLPANFADTFNNTGLIGRAVLARPTVTGTRRGA